MKTIKIYISTLLIAVAAVAYGQRTFVMEKLFPDNDQGIAHFVADNNMKKSRIEIWKHNLQGRMSEKVLWDVYEAPRVSRTFYVDRVEIIHEESLRLEEWMTVPFGSSMEEELNVESWMTVPFGSSMEEELNVESWMTVPFGSSLEEELNVESWMTVPFRQVFAEEQLNVETWMAEAWI